LHCAARRVRTAFQEASASAQFVVSKTLSRAGMQLLMQLSTDRQSIHAQKYIRRLNAYTFLQHFMFFQPEEQQTL